MAYRSESHRHFRTRRDLARDLTIVMAATISEGTKYGVFRDVAWTWTEGNRKYEGVPLWSKRALALYGQNCGKNSGLRHEHAVPIKTLYTLVEPLCQDSGPRTIDAVFQTLEKFNIAVIVTKEEQRQLDSSYRDRMPDEFNNPEADEYRDPMLRFRQCPQIKLVEVDADKLKRVARRKK